MKPVIFSTDMVKAILNTEPNVWPPEPVDKSKPYKSQTRRVAKIPIPIAGLMKMNLKYDYSRRPRKYITGHSRSGERAGHKNRPYAGMLIRAGLIIRDFAASLPAK